MMMFVAGYDHWFQGLENRLGIANDVIAFFCWAVPTVAMAMVYVLLMYKGTQAARYANR